ncbi:carnitine dehydratase [Burkholderia sp. Leaf177]|uniref:CaiB/BaiF CoA transferase family protein n=1 Tax=Burkholderia sp. Leaf177 TaxID=1736287 RepID=UPI0006F93650|nr:CoA transferase [Burkholderia sp. Leaf177]KQR81512.1 carnitine dehydratase [Burkholderia sp. Leaf177]
MIRDSLNGIRVLDFSHVVAGPVCTMTLADLGADVIKIEPLDGELGRRIGPPWIGGESAISLSVNRNKRSLAIDLKTDAGRRAVRRMAARADVVVESFRPGVMTSLGLDYDTLKADNPALVFCSISAYGQTGALRSSPGVDGVIQAVSGLMSTLGEPGSGPVKVPIPVADMVTGYLATISILAALTEVRNGRDGQHLDVSLFNATIMLQQIGFASFFASGKEMQKSGSAAPYASPNEAFETSDGWFMVAAYHPERWTALCEVLGADHLEADARFATNDDRVRNRDALHVALSRLFRNGTTAEWLARLAPRDILCAPVSSYSEVVNSAAYRDSGIDSTVDHPIAGRVRMPGFALGPSDRASTTDSAAPLAGQHSVDVLAQYGLSDDDIAALVNSGVIRNIVPQREAAVF